MTSSQTWEPVIDAGCIPNRIIGVLSSSGSERERIYLISISYQGFCRPTFASPFPTTNSLLFHEYRQYMLCSAPSTEGMTWRLVGWKEAEAVRFEYSGRVRLERRKVPIDLFTFGQHSPFHQAQSVSFESVVQRGRTHWTECPYQATAWTATSSAERAFVCLYLGWRAKKNCGGRKQR